MLVAVPLRGYAALAKAFCEQHHGMAAASQEMHAGMRHDVADLQNPAMHDHEGSRNLASACNLCSACCVNASVAADSTGAIALDLQRTARIPFLDVPASGVVTEQLDPPPLAL
ncbi:MAG: hypothetical protein ACREUO_02610 [Burkholderiales bacterium]